MHNIVLIYVISIFECVLCIYTIIVFLNHCYNYDNYIISTIIAYILLSLRPLLLVFIILNTNVTSQVDDILKVLIFELVLHWCSEYPILGIILFVSPKFLHHSTDNTDSNENTKELEHSIDNLITDSKIDIQNESTTSIELIPVDTEMNKDLANLSTNSVDTEMNKDLANLSTNSIKIYMQSNQSSKVQESNALDNSKQILEQFIIEAEISNSLIINSEPVLLLYSNLSCAVNDNNIPNLKQLALAENEGTIGIVHSRHDAIKESNLKNIVTRLQEEEENSEEFIENIGTLRNDNNSLLDSQWILMSRTESYDKRLHSQSPSFFVCLNCNYIFKNEFDMSSLSEDLLNSSLKLEINIPSNSSALFESARHSISGNMRYNVGSTTVKLRDLLTASAITVYLNCSVPDQSEEKSNSKHHASTVAIRLRIINRRWLLISHYKKLLTKSYIFPNFPASDQSSTFKETICNEDMIESPFCFSVPSFFLLSLSKSRRQQISSVDWLNLFSQETKRASISKVDSQSLFRTFNISTNFTLSENNFSPKFILPFSYKNPSSSTMIRFKNDKEKFFHMGEIYSNLSRIYSRNQIYGFSFRPSVFKKDPKFQFIPINLHLHVFSAISRNPVKLPSLENISQSDGNFLNRMLSSHDSQLLPKDNPRLVFLPFKPNLFPNDVSVIEPIVSVGAFSAHFLGFKNGGLSRLHNRLIKIEPNIHNDKSLLEEYNLLQSEIVQRTDIVFSQALTTLITSFVSMMFLGLLHPINLKRIASIGFLFSVQSLLSSMGNEKGMIEDMKAALDLLSCVKIRLARNKDTTDNHFTSFQNLFSEFYSTNKANSDNSNTKFSELRSFVDLNFKNDQEKRFFAFFVMNPLLAINSVAISSIELDMYCSQWNITLSVEKHLFDLLPEEFSLANISIVSIMFSQGINETQTVANAIGDTNLQDQINIKSIKILSDYFHSFCSFNHENSLQDVNWESSLSSLLQETEYIISKENAQKATNILHFTSDMCRVLNAGRVVCCKSAKDRTSMAITYEQSRILKFQYSLNDELSDIALNLFRNIGVRSYNALKNTGRRRYAFNAVQRALLPLEFRPSGKSCSRAVPT